MVDPVESPTATVMAVDDDLDVLAAYQRIFRRDLPHVRLLIAASPEAALEHVRLGRIDLALVDYRMPGMNGIEFLVAARRIQPDLHSMILTAYPDPSLATKATAQAGSSVVIAKPFELDMLSGAVAFFLDQIRLARDGPTRERVPRP